MAKSKEEKAAEDASKVTVADQDVAEAGAAERSGAVVERLQDRKIQTKYDVLAEEVQSDYDAEKKGSELDKVPAAIDGDGAGIRTVGNLRVLPDGTTVELDYAGNPTEEARKKFKGDGDPKQIVKRRKERRERRFGWARALRSGQTESVDEDK